MAWMSYVDDAEDRMVFFDPGLIHRPGVRSLGRLTIIGVHCRMEPTGTFWHPAETEALDALEDRLLEQLSRWGHGWAVYAARVAFVQRRDYLVYHNDRADIQSAVKTVIGEFPDYRLESTSEDDPGWAMFSELVRRRPPSSLL